MKKLLLNRKGVIALITMIVLAGVGMLGIAMVVTSQLNSVASNNYRYKIQTFNAADGMMTLLAQDILDFNESMYLTGRPHMDIGNPPVSGGYGYNPLTRTDTLRGSGSLHVGVKDSCHFSYCEMKGNMELVIKFATHKPGARGKAGIMVRQDLTAGAQYVLLAYVDRAIDTVRLQSRKAVGASSALRANASGVTLPMYLKLNKIDSIFYASYSTTGVTWTDLGKDTVRLIDPVYVGLAIASGLNKPDTAIFTNSAGIPIDTRLDTVKIGADSVPVIYRLNKMGADIFTMETEGYKTIGGSPAHNYETRLNQNLAREATGHFEYSAIDSALIPVTLYDFRSNLSCPEFNIRAEFKVGGKPVISHFVQDTLDSQRKPVLKPDVTYRSCILNLYDSAATPWYTTMTPQKRLRKSYSFPSKNTCYTNNGSKSTWMFCDSLYRWFRPWGDSAGTSETYTFDMNTGKWTGLIKRPNALGGQPTADSGWVSAHWDSTQHFANIVFYDTLTFRQDTGADTGLFTFGREDWATGADSRWFVSGCTDTCFHMSQSRFMPLKNKGFKDDWKGNTCTTSTDPCIRSQNFSYTMELHRNFLYKKGQIFDFAGDDDVWVFLNNHLVIDLAGIHQACTTKVNLDTLGLIQGAQYQFDMFYCERALNESDIFIQTNMYLWIPPQPLKRSWKRDYGNLD